MTTRKRLKALRRHKAIVRERNIRTNNLKGGSWSYIQRAKHVYRLYNI